MRARQRLDKVQCSQKKKRVEGANVLGFHGLVRCLFSILETEGLSESSLRSLYPSI